MIANVSPSSMCYEDTHNTLKYANRAKNIKTTVTSRNLTCMPNPGQVVRNVLNVNFHITKYTEIIEGLKQENLELKSKIREVSGKMVGERLDDDDSTLVDQMKAEIMANYHERMQVTQTLMGCEERYNELTEQFKQKKRILKRYDSSLCLCCIELI